MTVAGKRVTSRVQVWSSSSRHTVRASPAQLSPARPLGGRLSRWQLAIDRLPDDVRAAEAIFPVDERITAAGD